MHVHCDKGEIDITVFSQTSLLAGSFWLRQITTDPHTVADRRGDVILCASPELPVSEVFVPDIQKHRISSRTLRQRGNRYVSQTSLLAGLFWLRKITTDPHIVADVDIGCPDDRYPRLNIFVSE